MSLQRYQVQLVNESNARVSGTFLYDDESGHGRCKLVFQYSEGEITGEWSDFFEAMCQIRDRLESTGWRPVCYGSSRNVYATSTCRDMGRGLKGYRLELGHYPSRS